MTKNLSVNVRHKLDDDYHEHLIKQFEGIRYKSKELSIVTSNNPIFSSGFLPHINRYSSSVISSKPDRQEQTLKNLLSIPIGNNVEKYIKRHKSNLNHFNRNRRNGHHTDMSHLKPSLVHVPSIPRLEADLKFLFKNKTK
jgi:hypothetical protein